MSPQSDATRPLLTLTTDFGTAGGYVGAMKGRILSLVPNARLVDISHDVAPHDVREGAWCLRRAVPHFPPGTVHLAVVDPGVGGTRAGLVVETERFLLVGPDNGLLSLAAREEGLRRIVAVRESPPDRQRSVSFDGLTFFAPVAAQLLRGIPAEQLGDPVDAMVELGWPEPLCRKGMIEGEVLFFDRFGNAVTNITRAQLGESPVERVVLASGEQAAPCSHYGQLAEQPERVAAIWNSDGHLELALYGRSLRDERKLRVGEWVRVMLQEG
jgi:S-adenosylmethionine hydrolase